LFVEDPQLLTQRPESPADIGEAPLYGGDAHGRRA
jgi:hypothetical protein